MIAGLATDGIDHPPAPSVLEEASGRRLLWAALGLVLLFHGALLINQSFVRTYDALIHIFLGAHYAQSWFDPWEPRWYTGFSTVSYPPLSHQLIAIFSKVVDLKSAFAIVQLGALLNLTVGIYRFSKLLVGPRTAGYACLLLVVSSSITETVHVFGQLPTTLSLSFLLNAIPFALRYVREGRHVDLARAIAFMSATTAAHHVSTLFGSVFFTAPILVIGLLEGFRAPRPFEPIGEGFLERIQRRTYRTLPRLYRAGLFGGLTIVSLLLVVFPYWYWSKTDPILQVSIPHASRDSFIQNTAAGFVFFLVPWLSTCWFLPYALYKGFSSWRWPVAASLGLLFVLGTGGTTPIPRLLLRGAFDILTLDRFTFWATILILPFAGMALESAIHGRVSDWLDANFGRRVRLATLGLLVFATIAVAVGISSLTRYRKFQPEPIDVGPIVNFIEKDQHWRYRYLTLGFGDQMAWLSANTRGLTPDGNYHSARRLIELTTTPVERLDGAKYTGTPGIGSLEQFVTTPEKYNLKFIYSNDAFYDPLLFFSGWQRINRLENGIVVWEREDIPPLPERLPRKSLPIYQRVMWGILPPLAPLLALGSLALRLRRSRIWRFQRHGLGLWLLELLREDALEPQTASPWQPWRNLIRPLERVLNFQKRPATVRVLRLAGLIGLVALVVFATIHGSHRPQTPEAAVIAYWDDVDFKRFTEAFTRLDPQGGLTVERHLLDLSVQGGLRSGYAKLDAIEPKVIALEGDAAHPKLGDRALVRTRLTWVTSLERQYESFTQQLAFTARGWRILAWPLIKARPRDRFTEEPDIGYYRAPRRLTTEVTSAHDVLDRPQLAVLGMRLISRIVEVDNFAKPGKKLPKIKQRAFSIVGEIQNIDARPADLTVTGLLRDHNGQELARNNAGSAILHKLFPGERTPFRVDFIGPDAPKLPGEVKGFEVYAKAVVTARDLSRPLAAWTRQLGSDIQMTIANVGTHETSIARALMSLYDDRGLAWVDDKYLMESVPPREFRDLSAPAHLPVGYHLEQTTAAKDAPRGQVPTAPLAVPGLRAYRVQLQSFEGAP